MLTSTRIAPGRTSATLKSMSVNSATCFKHGARIAGIFELDTARTDFTPNFSDDTRTGRYVERICHYIDAMWKVRDLAVCVLVQCFLECCSVIGLTVTYKISVRLIASDSYKTYTSGSSILDRRES